MYEMLVGVAPFHARNRRQLFRNILNNNIDFGRARFTPEEKDIISCLCQFHVKDRLGSSPRDAKDVMGHAYFRDIDWDRLARKAVVPPFKPPLKSETDLRNFDKVSLSS